MIGLGSDKNSNSKHLQWSKLAGYFLNSKRNSDGWEEVSLDYDLLSYKVLISTKQDINSSFFIIRSALLQGFDLKKIKYQLFILHYTTCPLTS